MDDAQPAAISGDLPIEPETAAISLPFPPQPMAFKFVGSGAEYFRIWIINVLLTIVTLGVYSAWAKVRRLRYFYRCTELDGTGFEYHGRPLAILIGRIIAVALFVAYQYAAYVSKPLGAGVGLLLAVVAPWLMRNALRFRLHNSSYRGLRFGFTGSLGDAYLATFIGLILLIVLGIATAILIGIEKTLQLPWLGGVTILAVALTVAFGIYPYWYRAFKEYQHGNARFGNAAFSFNGSLRSFVWVFFQSFLIVIVIVIVAAVAQAIVGDTQVPGSAAQEKGLQRVLKVLPFLFVIYGGMLLVLLPFFRSRIDNLVWNSTALGPHRFENRLRARDLIVLYLTNFIGIVCTLGFYTPWAMVRSARYRAEHMTLILAEPIDQVLAATEAENLAFGDEVGGVFDIDISL